MKGLKKVWCHIDGAWSRGNKLWKEHISRAE